jgi:hypothetical protein
MNYVQDNAPTMTTDDTSDGVIALRYCSAYTGGVMALSCRSALFASHMIQIHSDKVHNIQAPAWGILCGKRED